jgi:deoxycytidine triphosphate deaminase
MILDGSVIAQAIQTGRWKAYKNGSLVGTDELFINTNSVDLTLGSTLLMPNVPQIPNTDTYRTINPCVDGNSITWDTVPLQNGVWVLPPHSCVYLAVAQERFDADLPLLDEDAFVESEGYYVPMFEGKSSLGRLGITVHQTASYGNYGFKAPFTMEIANNQYFPIALTPGMRIAQLSFQSVSLSVRRTPYAGPYSNNQNTPQPPIIGAGRFN